MHIPLPKVCAEAWQTQQNNLTEKRANPGLIFDKYSPQIGGEDEQEANGKKVALETVWRAMRNADRDLFEAWLNRYQHTLAALGAVALDPPLKTEWRLIAGFGRKNALEVGFAFHLYGFPFLPGSSLKGLARSWALLDLAEQIAVEADILENALGGEKDAEVEKKLKGLCPDITAVRLQFAQNFRAVFGTTACAGQVVFHDAIPLEFPRIEIDVLNPHYSEYYQSKGKPTNWQKLIPTFFLTVAPNTPFHFAVSLRGGAPASSEMEKECLQLALDWLKTGLLELGVGAKTAAGYGYFQ